MLVAHDVADRYELVVETPRGVCGRPPLLRREREQILILPRDAVLLGDVLARLAHCLGREQLDESRIGETPAERRVVQRAVAARKRLVRLRRDERCARHRLGAARHEELAVAGDHRMAGRDDCREAGGAESVHRHAGHRVRQAREQRGHARDVPVVLAGLVGRAEVDIFDVCRRHTGALDHGPDSERGEIVRPHACERAAVAPDRRAHTSKDDGAAPLRRRQSRHLRSL